MGRRRRVEVRFGDVFGRLTIVKEITASEHGNRRVLCKCICGTERIFGLSAIRSGNTKSCGCYRSEYVKEKNTTHNLSGTPLYKVWSQMKQRCENKNDKAYKNYGERGIKTVEEWKNFESFYEWALKSGYKEGLTIERKDVDGNYSPGNCTWIPFEEQSKNRRINRMITYEGETKTLSEWARLLGIDRKTLDDRLTSGWSIEDSFNKTVSKTRRRNNRLITFEGVTKTITEWDRDLGFSSGTIRHRLARGWTLEKALQTRRNNK